MSGFGGSNIVTNGLVMYYDMNNVIKSNIGPTNINYARSSQDFTNASHWAKNSATGSTVLVNQITAPDGTLTASKLNENATNSVHELLSGTGNGTREYVTISCHVKAAERTSCYIRATGNSKRMAMSVNLLTGEFVTTNWGATRFTSGKVTPLSNGWFRLSLTAMSDFGFGSAEGFGVGFYVGPTDTYVTNVTGLIGGSGYTYQGVDGFGIYIWGAQFELSSVVSPYIPTTSTPIIVRSKSQSLLDLTGINQYNVVTADTSDYEGCLTYDPDGSFRFNSFSDYITAGNSTALQLSSAITMESWINPVTTSANGNIVSKNENNGFRYRVNSSRQLEFIVGGSSNVIAGGTVPLNAWSHCVVTGDSSGLKAYINGELVSSNTTAYAPPNVSTATAPASPDLYIGCFLQRGTDLALREFFHGRINVCKIYNQALTAAEVKQNYNALKGRFGL